MWKFMSRYLKSDVSASGNKMKWLANFVPQLNDGNASRKEGGEEERGRDGRRGKKRVGIGVCLFRHAKNPSDGAKHLHFETPNQEDEKKKPAKTHKNGEEAMRWTEMQKEKWKVFFWGVAKNGFLIHACLLRSRGRTKDLFILLYLRAGWRNGGISKP